MTTGRTPAGHWPGEPALWSLICSDMILFSVMFVSYSTARHADHAAFAAAHWRLNQSFGFINTVLLLASSWLIAAAVRAARTGDTRLARRLILLGMACGAGFVAIKITEYGEKLRQGLTPQSGAFFTYYFTLTGIHMVHVLIALVVMALLALRLRQPALRPQDLVLLESGASFWHLVDMLWIMLFALFYLMR